MVAFDEFKKFFIYNMIFSLVICALIAVVSVLVGDFTETAMKAILTVLMITLHSLIALTFIWDDEKQGTFDRFSFFINVIFILIVLSFFVSIFGIWNLAGITGHVGDIYQYMGILAFAALHGNILYKASGKENYIDMIIVLNYIFIFFVVLMFAPLIFMKDPILSLGNMFFRILGAASIIDGTLTILTIIFYKLHLHKYPKEENPLVNSWGYANKEPPKAERGKLSIWVWILIIYLIIQVVFPFLGMIFFRGIF